MNCIYCNAPLGTATECAFNPRTGMHMPLPRHEPRGLRRLAYLWRNRNFVDW